MVLLLPEVKHLYDKEHYTGVFSGMSICAEADKEMIRELAELRFWNYPGLIGDCGCGICVKVIQGLPEEDVSKPELYQQQGYVLEIDEGSVQL